MAGITPTSAVNRDNRREAGRNGNAHESLVSNAAAASESNGATRIDGLRRLAAETVFVTRTIPIALGSACHRTPAGIGTACRGLLLRPL